jgi:Fur family peroxide stress response transcriptional regulator
MQSVAAAVARLEALCRRQGLPLTVQRRAVLETLLGRADHPTAEQIYGALAQRLPGVSRATVYRILEVLVRAGVARKVFAGGAAARFELPLRRHHHLICVVCDKVADFRDPALDGLSPRRGGRQGFQVMDYTVQFLGVCRQCAAGAARGARQPSSRRVRHARK